MSKRGTSGVDEGRLSLEYLFEGGLELIGVCFILTVVIVIWGWSVTVKVVEKVGACT